MTLWKRRLNEQRIKTMEENLFNVGDVVKVTGSAYKEKLGKFVTIKKVAKTQCLVVFPDGEEEWIDYECLLPKGKDMVNHPSHYNQNGIECFEVIRAALGTDGLRQFMLGNSIKYLFRCEHKGQYIEDLKKARFYVDQAIKIHEEP